MSQNECSNYWWLTDVKMLHVAPLCQSNIETEKQIYSSNLMFLLAPFPCKQSPCSILIEPWETGSTELLRKEKINPSMYFRDLQRQYWHAMPCHATPGKQTVTSTLGVPWLMPALCFFFPPFTPCLYIHPFLSLLPPSDGILPEQLRGVPLLTVT